MWAVRLRTERGQRPAGCLNITAPRCRRRRRRPGPSRRKQRASAPSPPNPLRRRAAGVCMICRARGPARAERPAARVDGFLSGRLQAPGLTIRHRDRWRDERPPVRRGIYSMADAWYTAATELLLSQTSSLFAAPAGEGGPGGSACWPRWAAGLGRRRRLTSHDPAPSPASDTSSCREDKAAAGFGWRAGAAARRGPHSEAGRRLACRGRRGGL